MMKLGKLLLIGLIGVNVPAYAACVTSKPSVGLNPGFVTVARGQSKDVDVIIYNYDSADCPSSTFHVTGTVPSGLTTTIPVADLQVKAGGQMTTRLTLNALAKATLGEQDLRVDVKDGNAAHDGFTYGTINVTAK